MRISTSALHLQKACQTVAEHALEIDAAKESNELYNSFRQCEDEHNHNHNNKIQILESPWRQEASR